ncbi:YceI family protein [Photobacterium sp. SDRW27]|uniref:YceI family protein n=1 Tax=Photobacterium obscurum TaxID=2829490 RepID=UPI00224403B7|nr:YceI family protein [Photobacterium obscurum]MCW8328551.1 YceI family protein [Photobacterium obscurum]
MRLCFRLLLAGLLLLGVNANVLADWKLDSNHSNVNFLSVKNDSVIEQHYFRNISGSISDKGEVKLAIDLTSIDTQISIRDERMKKELFETEGFPVTTLTAEIDPVMLSDMTPGKTQSLEVEFMLDLHGVKQTLAAKLQVTGLEKGGLLVSTIWPVEIKSEAFGLDKGIAALKEIAKLNSILLSVPVNAQLAFIK